MDRREFVKGCALGFLGFSLGLPLINCTSSKKEGEHTVKVKHLDKEYYEITDTPDNLRAEFKENILPKVGEEYKEMYSDLVKIVENIKSDKDILNRSVKIIGLKESKKEGKLYVGAHFGKYEFLFSLDGSKRNVRNILEGYEINDMYVLNENRDSIIRRIKSDSRGVFFTHNNDILNNGDWIHDHRVLFKDRDHIDELGFYSSIANLIDIENIREDLIKNLSELDFIKEYLKHNTLTKDTKSINQIMV